MLLTLVTALLVQQSAPSTREIMSVIRARFAPAVVEESLLGAARRIAIRHLEPGPSQVGGQQGGQQTTGKTPPPLAERVTYTDQIILLPKGAPRSALNQLSWEPGDPNYRTLVAYLGIASGFQWYVNATYHPIALLRHDFSLSGGESSVNLAVRALEARDWRNSSDALDDLRQIGDDAVDALEDAAKRTREAISVLGAIRTSKAVQALVRLHSDDRLKADVEATFGGGAPVAEAKPIYVAGLRDGTNPVAAARAALRFGWKEMLPAIDRAYATTASDYEALELLDLRHRMRTGSSLPSFEKVHQFFRGWTPHDERAVLQANDHDYGVLVALRMISYCTKRGVPYRADGIRLLNALKRAGLATWVDAMVSRFRYDGIVETGSSG